jgi:hypothetical protein
MAPRSESGGSAGNCCGAPEWGSVLLASRRDQSEGQGSY